MFIHLFSNDSLQTTMLWVIEIIAGMLNKDDCFTLSTGPDYLTKSRTAQKLKKKAERMKTKTFC